MKRLKILIYSICLILTTGLFSQPSPQWVSSFNGAQNENDRSVKSVTDNSGNIYITGTTFDPVTKENTVVLKYNSSGVLQWSRFYTGEVQGGNDIPADIKLDANGNVYVLISSPKPNYVHLNRLVLLKYTSSGNLSFTKIYESDNITGRKAHSLYIANNSIYFTELWSFLNIHKADMNGNIVNSFTSSNSNVLNKITSMISDNSGNLYAVGSENEDIVFYKLNSNMNITWVKTYAGIGNGFDIAYRIGADDNFNFYIGGVILSPVAGNDYCIIKYNQVGTQQWVKTYNGPANGNDELNDLAVTGSGDVFVTGKSSGGSSGFDFVTIKYNTAGTQQWLHRYDGPVNGDDLAQSLILDSQGGVYTGGTSKTSANVTDYTVVKYSAADGTIHWTSNNNLSASDTLTGMIIDNNSNIIVYGNSKRFLNNDRDIAVFKLGSTIGISQIGSEIPKLFELKQNYPNPFNPATIINFSLPISGIVKLQVYNSTGQLVTELVNKYLNAGMYSYEFSAIGLPSGIYFYRIESNEFSEVKKMILVK
jgi:hypothetical protein